MNGGKMSNKYEFIAPCHFGLEAVCKREIADLGYEIVKVEDGKVTFAGDMGCFGKSKHFLKNNAENPFKSGRV